MKIDNLIEPHFIKSLNIDTDKDYTIHECPAIDLLNDKRIDIVAKYKYIKSVESGIHTNFFEDVYKATIEAFSEGLYSEPGNSNKNSFAKYKEIFINLNDEITRNGFNANKSIFMIGNNNSILDGGHRAAIAIKNNIKVPYIKIEDKSIDYNNYNLDFFKKRLVDTEYLDYLCYEYCKMKDNTYVIVLWSTLDKDKKKEAIQMISNRFNIVYKKDILLSFNGLKNFMIDIYGHQDWIGSSKDHFSGIQDKAYYCYREKNELTAVIVESENAEDILKTKDEIRNKMGIGNHSVHSTDNHKETVQMLSLLLNDNSIAFLNYANIDRYLDTFELLNEFKLFLKKMNENIDNVIIDGNFLLKMYGKENTDKIKFLTKNRHLKSSEKFEAVVCNQKYNKDLDDLIYNKSNYFYYYGLKFINIDFLKIQNNNKEQVKIINKIINNKQNNRISRNFLKISRIKRKIIKKAKYILKKTHIYKFFYK